MEGRLRVERVYVRRDSEKVQRKGREGKEV